MLFHSSIRKELARSFGATFIVLVTVVMTMTLIRTLGQASRGSFNPSDVMMVVGYTVLTFLPNITTVGLFIAIVATLTRIYRDGEMVIWFGAGTGLFGLLGPLFRFAWPVLLAVAGLALFGLPWANQQIEDIREHYEKRGDLERVEPGRFQESADGSRVFFVEKNASNLRSGNNVFIATTEPAKETVTTAGSGRIETIGNDQFLLLFNGQRLENTITKPEPKTVVKADSKPDLTVSEFEEYGTRVSTGNVDLKDAAPLGAVPSLTLVVNPTTRHLGELSWRIGFALAAVNLIILAIASSRINPRVGRTGNLVFSLFAFQIYLNLLNLGQNWIAQEKIGFAQFLLALHGGVFVLCAFWLMMRHNNWSFVPRRRSVLPS
jgi:lipopolysaccharide export system permease protein